MRRREKKEGADESREIHFWMQRQEDVMKAILQETWEHLDRNELESLSSRRVTSGSQMKTELPTVMARGGLWLNSHTQLRGETAGEIVRFFFFFWWTWLASCVETLYWYLEAIEEFEQKHQSCFQNTVSKTACRFSTSRRCWISQNAPSFYRCNCETA